MYSEYKLSVSSMLELATHRLPKLASVANLLEALHENAMLYCALKGNENHLRVSMTGESDIDILFDEHQKEKLELLLARLGFKKFEAIKPKQYPHIVDFLTLDVESGMIVHLHTHYRISVGKPYLKGYQLEIGRHILNTRIFNQDFGTYCISPSAELILLYLTESLKLRLRDLITIYLGGKVNVSQKATYEYNWLRKRVTDEEMKVSMREVFDDDATALFHGEFDRKHLYRLAPFIKRQIAGSRPYSSLQALLLRWYREITVAILRKLSRTMHWPVLSARTSPRGGVMVALTGSRRTDPSIFGRMLKETFGKKLDVYTVDLEWPAGRFIAMKNAVLMFCANVARRKGALVICNHRAITNVRACAPDLAFQLISAKEDAGIVGASQAMRVDEGGVTPGKASGGLSDARLKVMAIDTEKPLKENLDSMKREIWNIL